MQRVNRGLIVSGGLVLLMIGVLAVMGREWICTCGTIKLWHEAVFSSENSQHISDWYTPSHLIHGFLFYGLGWLVLRRQHWGWRLALARSALGMRPTRMSTPTLATHSDT